jgi:GT2 family glycosyltransferase
MAVLTAAAIICTRNRLEPLITCLASISQQTYPINQLIVVDSSEPPMESSTAFANSFNPERFVAAELIYLKTQPALTFQRNQGVALSTTDVVFFFDDDVVVSPRFIEYLMETFKTHTEYGGGMGAIANVRIGQKRASDYLRHFFLLTHSLGTGRMQKSGLPSHSHGRSEFMDVEILSGGLTAYRASVLREFNFDEGVTGYAYMEDVDFSYRVSRRYKLFYDPRAVVEHRHVPIARDTVTANRKMYLVNHHYFFFKNVYPNCHLCIAHYVWAVLGLFILALLGGHWQALVGYWAGIGELLKLRLAGDANS